MIIESIIGGMLIMTPIDNKSNYNEQLEEIGQAKCLADNMYFEARNQGTAGITAVSNVVLNRVKSKMYPSNICEVVRQGPHRESWRKNGEYHPVRHKCQFSWYCDGKSDEPKDSVTWIESIRIADMALQSSNFDVTEGALWYHADYIHPYWADHLEYVVTIENHIFYK